MCKFYLIRHGETDSSVFDTDIHKAHGSVLAPLTEKGIAQLEHTALDERLKNAEFIIASPFCRTMQSAAIISRILNKPMYVECGIHEWSPDKENGFITRAETIRRSDEFSKNNGIYPEGADLPWETNEMMKRRMIETLSKYSDHTELIAVCHCMVIAALTGVWTANGQIVEFEL